MTGSSYISAELMEPTNMHNSALAVCTEQYEGISKAAVRSAQREVEKAVELRLAETRHKAPKRLARIVRVALNAFDDVEASELDRLLSDPAALLDDLRALARRRGGPGTENRQRLVLGAGETVAVLSDDEARTPLSAEVEEVSEDDVYYRTLSTDEAGEQLGTSRQTVNQWVREGKLVGFQGAKRGVRVPAAQISRRRPTPGVAAVVDAFGGDHELAWHFLVAEQDVGERAARPLALLQGGEDGLVVELAKGYGSSVL